MSTESDGWLFLRSISGEEMRSMSRSDRHYRYLSLSLFRPRGHVHVTSAKFSGLWTPLSVPKPSNLPSFSQNLANPLPPPSTETSYIHAPLRRNTTVRRRPLEKCGTCGPTDADGRGETESVGRAVALLRGA